MPKFRICKPKNSLRKNKMKLENIIYCCDNLTWLKKFPDKCIDLIYLDPLFFSNKQYEVIFNDGEEIPVKLTKTHIFGF